MVGRKKLVVLCLFFVLQLAIDYTIIRFVTTYLTGMMASGCVQLSIILPEWHWTFCSSPLAYFWSGIVNTHGFR